MGKGSEMVDLNDNKEIVFWVNTDPMSNLEWQEIRLKHLGIDESGLKLAGDLPNLWEAGGEEFIGPELYDDNAQYTVVKVDYNNGLIWLNQI
jgi:hypothetical protein